MRRMIYAIGITLFLAGCVLAGAANPWYLYQPWWIQLAFAGLVGLAAGGLAPRVFPGWASWFFLVLAVWIASIFAADQYRLAYWLAASASVGVAAGLVAWRLTYAQRFWRPVPLCVGAAVIFAFAIIGRPRPLFQPAYTPPAFHPFTAPAYTLHLLDGKTIHSENLAEKTVVLAFWATWCSPCREELPRLQKLYARHYRNNPDVVFYLVDVGDGVDTRGKAREFLKKHGITLPSAFDAQGKLMDDLHLPSELPTRIVIGTDGKVSYRAIGYGSYASGFPRLRNAIAGSRQMSSAR